MQFPTDSLNYLKKLAKNNNREWFKDNKQDFDALQKLNKQFFMTVYEDLQQFDELENLKQFRIYRDIRFSKDKTPYKNHFSANFVRATKKRRGTFYLHIQPGNESFCAGGFYGPEKEDLFRIRKEFEYDAEPIRVLLNSKESKKFFPNGLQGEELKTSPRDFSKDDENIDLIRKKQFYLQANFTDNEVTSSTFSKTVVDHFKAMLPFLNYMSEVVTTDLNGRPIV